MNLPWAFKKCTRSLYFTLLTFQHFLLSVSSYKKAFCLSKISRPKTQSYYSLNPFAYVRADILTDFQVCMSVFKVKSVKTKNYKKNYGKIGAMFQIGVIDQTLRIKVLKNKMVPQNRVVK